MPPEREQQIETLYRTRYSGFTAKHFREHLVRDHGFSWGYTWTKVFLQSKGLLSRAKTRGAHRRKRPRRPLPGMMLHQDGSRHEWLAGLDAMDLIRRRPGDLDQLAPIAYCKAGNKPSIRTAAR